MNGYKWDAEYWWTRWKCEAEFIRHCKDQKNEGHGHKVIRSNCMQQTSYDSENIPVL